MNRRIISSAVRHVCICAIHTRATVGSICAYCKAINTATACTMAWCWCPVWCLCRWSMRITPYVRSQIRPSLQCHFSLDQHTYMHLAHALSSHAFGHLLCAQVNLPLCCSACMYALHCTAFNQSRCCDPGSAQCKYAIHTYMGAMAPSVNRGTSQRPNYQNGAR